MKTVSSSLFRLLASSSFLLLASTVVAQGTGSVWIVDFFSGPDADFESIQPAVDAATDGDTILVRGGGLYDGFTIDDKALVIASDTPGVIDFEAQDQIVIENLAAGKTVALKGFGPRTGSARERPPTLVANNCQGTLWIEECGFGPLLPPNLSIPSTPAASFTDCIAVVLTDCYVQGKASLVRSGMHAFATVIGPAEDGSEQVKSGLELDSSFCFLSGSQALGTPGYVVGTVPCPSNGGPGVLLSNASELFVQDSLLMGGAIDPGDWVTCYLLFQITQGGVPGPPISQDPASVVEFVPGTARQFLSTSVARQTIRLDFRGAPGELVYYFESAQPAPVFLPYLNGSFLIGEPNDLTVLGPLDATGSLVLEIPALLASGLAETRFGQAIFVDGSGLSFAGSGDSTTVVDPSVFFRAGRDCNQNGISDDEDVALGISLDCNRNGEPDECEAFTPVPSQVLYASDPGSLDAFGYSLDVDGGTLVVGAPRNGAGAVYVFELQGGVWTQTAKLVAIDTVALVELFGGSVDLEGDVLMIGAPGTSSPPFFNSGVVYCFERVADTWTQVQKLQQSSTSSAVNNGRYFGEQVALDGGELMISGPNDTRLDSHSPSGPQARAYAFRKFGSTWQEVQVLDPVGSPSSYGLALSLDLPYCAIGSDDDGSNNADGVVYMYQLQGSTWSQVKILRASDDSPAEDAGFGSAVSMQDDTLVVGSWLKARHLIQCGALYVFERDALQGWVERRKLGLLDEISFDIGSAVDLQGDLIIASGPQGNPSGSAFPRVGACIFRRGDNGVWSSFEHAALFQRVDAVAIEGRSVFLGNAFADAPGLTTHAEGGVFVFEDPTPDPCLVRGPIQMQSAPPAAPR